MKRRLLATVAIMLVCITLPPACTKMAKERNDLFLTAAYSVVGLYGAGYTIHTDSNVYADIETDQYGRELFIVRIENGVWFYNTIGEKTETVYDMHGKHEAGYSPSRAMVILQKHDDRYICYYEDYCFLMETKGGFSDEKVEELKQKNDWNQPLQFEKCSTRINGEIGEGMTICWDDAKRAVLKVLPGTVRMFYVVSDANDKQLYGVSTYDEHLNTYKAYYVIFDPALGGIDAANGFMELQTLDFGEELHELKMRNNWNFTDCPGA